MHFFNHVPEKTSCDANKGHKMIYDVHRRNGGRPPAPSGQASKKKIQVEYTCLSSVGQVLKQRTCDIMDEVLLQYSL
jgi:hypothetical protein